MPSSPQPFDCPIPEASPALLALPDEIHDIFPNRLFLPEAIARLSKTNRRHYIHITTTLRRKTWIDALPSDPTLPSQIGMEPTGKWNRPCTLSHHDSPEIVTAIESGDLNHVESLLTSIPINSLDPNSNCLLHLALISHQIPIARLLLSKGAYPDGYHPSTIPELDQLFLSPSNTGPQCPHIRQEILELLLSHEASISRFPTQNMIYGTKAPSLLLEYLLDHHPETIDLRSASGHTLLHTAAALGDRWSCQFLLEKAPHLLTMDTDWDVTVLHMAILEKNEFTACWLISCGVHFHARSGFNRTELFLAATLGLSAVVRALLASQVAERAYPPGKWLADAKAAVRMAMFLGNTQIATMIRTRFNLSWRACLKGYLTWSNRPAPETPNPRKGKGKGKGKQQPRRRKGGNFTSGVLPPSGSGAGTGRGKGRGKGRGR
ncbi:ankyrin repeat domain-containing protein [Aspergillus ibericus CBS 121593]|uniref:Ankyrin n=1 Tax=Aspergillus ibericus CBS 121593 TaxID=1448316 RepID=A0A395GYH0_9EURO|nr:ankyrin [Aspergillus ibericus CBS 121593]RAL00119.1 ankyrin [Aspergillus ibericus CBS 121593]